MQNSFLIFLVFLPLIYALARRKTMTSDAFVLNERSGGLLLTTASLICGNIGIGSFVAIYLFAAESPIIGYSIAGAYTLGLVMSGILAQRVHERARRFGAFGLVDLIINTHSVSNKYLIWLPVAAVFLMRTVVQLIALATIISGALGLSFVSSLLVGGGVVMTYTLIGGYKFATETDFVQAVAIILGILALYISLPEDTATTTHFFDLSQYGFVFLISIWLFLPFSAVLAVDNWQRLSTAAEPCIARHSFLLAAIVCGFAYFVVAMAGSRVGGLDVLGSLRSIVGGHLSIIIDIMLIASIMSSIDTFIMPLVTTLAKGKSLQTIRLIVAVLFIAAGLTALSLGHLIDGVITAFNTLTVFLPAAFGAVFLEKPDSRAACFTTIGGFICSLVVNHYYPQAAGVVGFAVAASGYALLSMRHGRISLSAS